jgi:adenylate cyclase class 2
VPATKTKKTSESARTGDARRSTDLEIEVKLKCETLARLTDAGLTLEPLEDRHFEDNWVYNLPDGKLDKGQYLRVRYIRNGAQRSRAASGTLTYKGKTRRAAERQSRARGKKVKEEIETSIGKPTKVVKILKRLGLRRSFRYERYRSVFRVWLDDGRSALAMFDETPIGNFLELEGDTHTIEDVARQLGFCKRDFVADSYVEIQLARCLERGEPLSDMVFPARRGKSGKRASRSTKGQKGKQVPW